MRAVVFALHLAASGAARAQLEDMIDLHVHAAPAALLEYPIALALNAFLPRFRAAGFDQADIDLMTKRNPARILGIETRRPD